ncbi:MULTISPECIES: hypothetical protein [unclassified Sphingobacterium]|nr:MULTISPECIES: hypothetical protein [unclassified Sphingobacterium]
MKTSSISIAAFFTVCSSPLSKPTVQESPAEVNEKSEPTAEQTTQFLPKV